MSRKTDKDPTGQRVNRRSATVQVQKRITTAWRQVKALFLSIPYSRARAADPIVNASLYDYDLEETEYQSLVTYYIMLNLLGGSADLPAPDWFLSQYAEMPHRQGAIDGVNRFSVLMSSLGVLGALTAEQLLFSDVYRKASQSSQLGMYRAVKLMAERLSAQVVRETVRGVDAKLSQGDITQAITERFSVAKSEARRIIATEVNKAYNDGLMQATNTMADASGLRPAVIHISALMPTTRRHHADRHGNAYTIEDQNSWWDEGANRINCHCSVRPVLIDANGKVVQSSEQKEIKERGRRFYLEIYGPVYG